MQKMQKTAMTPLEGPILRGMIQFAVPIALSALLTMLFSSVDVIVIGQFGHKNAIAAIGVSASALNFLIDGLTGLSSGVMVTAGNYYGKGEIQKVRKLMHSLPLTALFLGGVLSVLAINCSEIILHLLNCPDYLMQDALLYFRIYFLGVPFTVFTSFLSAVIQAKGNSAIPFLFQIIASVINILLNLLSVIVFRMDVAGVAIATVISQILLAAAIFLYMQKQQNEWKIDFKRFRLFAGAENIFSIGIQASLEGMILNLSGVIIASAINGFDAAVIAGNSVASTIEGLMVVTFIGFSSAGTVYISQNAGAGNKERVKKVFVFTISVVFLLGESAGIVLYLSASRLLLLFTADSATIACAIVRMRYMCLFFGFCGIMNVIGGCLRGLGDARSPLIISILCSVCFRLTWLFTYAAWRGTVGAIYQSYPICWGLCALLNFLAFCRLYRKKYLCTGTS